MHRTEASRAPARSAPSSGRWRSCPGGQRQRHGNTSLTMRRPSSWPASLCSLLLLCAIINGPPTADAGDRRRHVGRPPAPVGNNDASTQPPQPVPPQVSGSLPQGIFLRPRGLTDVPSQLTRHFHYFQYVGSHPDFFGPMSTPLATRRMQRHRIRINVFQISF